MGSICYSPILSTKFLSSWFSLPQKLKLCKVMRYNWNEVYTCINLYMINDVMLV